MQKIWDPLRKKFVALTPEEKVRQWFIGVLRDHVKVPVWMMMSEVAMKLGKKDYRADILVYARSGSPLMVVECKREEVALGPDVLDQILCYNLVLNVPYLVITNGLNTFIFERAGDGYKQMNSLPDWESLQG